MLNVAQTTVRRLFSTGFAAERSPQLETTIQDRMAAYGVIHSGKFS
jgi:hypothetical protein